MSSARPSHQTLSKHNSKALCPPSTALISHQTLSKDHNSQSGFFLFYSQAKSPDFGHKPQLPVPLPSFYSQTEPPDFVHRPQLFSLCLQPDQVTRLCPQTTTTSLSSLCLQPDRVTRLSPQTTTTSLSSLFPQPDQATRLCPQTTLSSIFAVARANYEPVSINHNPLSSFFPTARTKSSVSIHKPQFSALLLSSLQPGHITARCQQTTTPSPSAPVFSTSGEGFHWDRWDYSCVRLRERVRRDVCKRKQTMEQKQRSCPIPQSSCSISPELLLHVRRAANRKLITGPCATLSASPSSASS